MGVWQQSVSSHVVIVRSSTLRLSEIVFIHVIRNLTVLQWSRPPFRLTASVSWCWSWEKEGRAVEIVPGIYAVHWKFSMCIATRTSSYSPVGLSVFFVYLAQVCALCVHLCFLICLYVVCPHYFMFPWAVESSPLQFLALV